MPKGMQTSICYYMSGSAISVMLHEGLMLTRGSTRGQHKRYCAFVHVIRYLLRMRDTAVYNVILVCLCVFRETYEGVQDEAQ